jgi:hypothetical protein
MSAFDALMVMKALHYRANDMFSSLYTCAIGKQSQRDTVIANVPVFDFNSYIMKVK